MTNLRQNNSIWVETESMPKFNSLKQDVDVDVCIVGGGIAGLTTAYKLMQESKSVCILEAYELASGQTARTTAHFSTALDDRYFELEKLHGARGAMMAAQSHAAAINEVEKIILLENIDCEMKRVDGYLFASGDSRKEILEKEQQAIHRAGLTNVSLVDRAPLESFDTGICLKFPEQLELHPLKYLSQLTDRIVNGGGLIFTNTHVNEVVGGENAFVKTDDGHKVKCKSIVVATNSPINDMFAIHSKQSAYRTYVLGLLVPKNSITHALYWDTLDPYHYMRLEKSPDETVDILIVGGEDHKTGQDLHPEEHYKKLEAWARARFPMAGEVMYQWSGQVMEPVDGLGYMGRNPMDKENVYIITADSGNGMTHCTIGAMIITDLIMGRENIWKDLYNPSRISFRALPEFIKENANVAAQYEDWLKAKPKPSFQDLPHDSGTVYRHGLSMVAIYKDEIGNVEFMSASCPHAAAVVTWNSAEKSWDCPCHGSRFDCHGKVIEGPAVSDLKKINDNDEIWVGAEVEVEEEELRIGLNSSIAH